MAARIASAAFRIGLADGGQQAPVLALAAGDEVLPLAHQPCQRPAALGEAHRHLGERIGGPGLQRPLRQLEALLASLAAAPPARCTARAAARRFQVFVCQRRPWRDRTRSPPRLLAGALS